MPNNVVEVTNIIDVIDEDVANNVDMIFLDDPLVGLLWDLERDELEEYDEVVASLMGLGFYTKNPVKWDFDLKSCESPPIKPSILEPPKVELKHLPPISNKYYWGMDVYYQSSLQVTQTLLSGHIKSGGKEVHSRN